MNEWKTIIRSIGVFIILIGIGFLAGFLTAGKFNQKGNEYNRDRIAELEQLNQELESGYTELEKDYQRSESKLTDFLREQEQRNGRALAILDGSEDKANEAGSSIERALRSLARMSDAIDILFAENPDS